MEFMGSTKEQNQKIIQKMSLIPFFSIIIPVFRSQYYFERCIQSCLNQTFSNFELIIIDDCGNDKSIQIAQKYQKTNPKVIILHNPSNLGAFHSRLKGIQYASGQYCLFVDSDDFIAPNTLETLYQIIIKNSPDIIQYRFSYFPKKFLKPSPPLKNSFFSNPKIYQTLNTSTVFQSICDKCIKTHYVKLIANKLSFIQSPFSCMEDGLFFLVLSFEVQSYQSLNQILYFYQDNPYSTTKLASKEIFSKKILDFKNGLKILQDIIRLYPQHSALIKKYRQKIISAYILEGRRYERQNLVEILQALNLKSYLKFTSSPLSGYLLSTLLSIKIFYRWQTLVRIAIYISTFGKIKL